MYRKSLFFGSLLAVTTVFVSCDSSDDPNPSLEIPSTYISANYEANVQAEEQVMDDLADLTSALNDAEKEAPNAGLQTIEYPAALAEVTLPAYRSQINNWISELINAANSATAFQVPDNNGPASGEEGGLLGTRLLDETGLELEQMIEKGSFGAAQYNHAQNIINGELTAASIDQLVEVFGTSPAFSPDEAGFAAKYAKRRSDSNTQKGFFFDMKSNLITARAAIEAGAQFNDVRDEALTSFLQNWEKSNYATVIYYCQAAKVQLQNATDDESKGNAMHAYAEGVAFTAGFKGLNNKIITDSQIDEILDLLLAPTQGSIKSYAFLTDASLLSNFDAVISNIQSIYGFSDEEVARFYVNDPSITD